jgi:alkanesulfonate monooxygenase SsuD/methylene tetrahydromethanopterin reductase-like flavin-dependent oxidoreductase (luciferase family)
VPEQVAVTLPVEDGLTAADYVGLAELAERCGYDAVLAGEVAGPEVFGLLGMIAARTTSIRIGSGIVGCYARPPALTAMGFATLASCAPGRVIAGLGASSPIITEGWYGTPFVNPVATAGEFIAVLRQALTGETVSFAGRQLSSDGFRATMIPPSPVPVLLAAMNPAMLRLAGRAADGVFITWTPPGEVASRLAHVRDGERPAGRPPGQVWAAASFWAYCGPRTAEATERLRRVVLQYAMVPTHQASFRGSFPALDEAAAAWGRGDRRGAAPGRRRHRARPVRDRRAGHGGRLHPGAAGGRRSSRGADPGGGGRRRGRVTGHDHRPGRGSGIDGMNGHFCPRT